jgi:hypothetical protein
MSTRQLCALLGVNRSWFYAAKKAPVGEGDTALRDRIEEIVLEFPGYGYRRVTATLHREGWAVNHKRVLRVMREESLLCQLERRWVRTTDSQHALTRYPNLAKDLALSGVNQLWIAEIVCTQMTKAHVLATGARRDDVANLYLPVCHDHAVDEEFDQLAFLVKARRGQSNLDPSTELCHGCHQAGEFSLPTNLPRELAFLIG